MVSLASATALRTPLLSQPFVAIAELQCLELTCKGHLTHLHIASNNEEAGVGSNAVADRCWLLPSSYACCTASTELEGGGVAAACSANFGIIGFTLLSSLSSTTVISRICFHTVPHYPHHDRPDRGGEADLDLKVRLACPT